mgnify:FL=1
MDMKKIMALCVLMIFVVSVVPMAFADNGGTRERAGADVSEDTERPELFGQGIAVNAKQKMEKVRERLGNANKGYLAAKEKYADTKKRFTEHKEELLQVRDRARLCEDESEECKEIKGNLKVGVKNHLVKTSDLILRSLDKLIERVSESTQLTDEEKESTLEKITLLEEDLTVLKDDVNAMEEDASAEELRDAIKELKSSWQEIRKEQRMVIAALSKSKWDNLVEKHGEYHNGMEMRIADLNEQGVDTGKLDNLASEFAERVVTLEEDHARAKDVWVQVKTGEQDIVEWKRTQDILKNDLKNTRELLRMFMDEYKSLRTTGEE